MECTPLDYDNAIDWNDKIINHSLKRIGRDMFLCFHEHEMLKLDKPLKVMLNWGLLLTWIFELKKHVCLNAYEHICACVHSYKNVFCNIKISA